MKDLLIEPNEAFESDLLIKQIKNGTVMIIMEVDEIQINSDQAIEIIEHLKKQFNLYGN